LVGPKLNPSHVSDLAAEHTHMTVPFRCKHSDADHVTHVHFMLLLFRHVSWDINPYAISCYVMVEVFPVQIDRVAFKFNP
jgi:hypothetical protein